MRYNGELIELSGPGEDSLVAASADDFVHLVDYIRLQNPTAAENVALAVTERIAELKKFPQLGRPGREKNTRELIVLPLPFIVVYRVREEFVELVRILHAAQRWP